MEIGKVTVNTPITAYWDMRQHWAPIETLMGGTLAMRAAGETHLPRFAQETTERYTTRLNEAALYEALPHTIETLAARPFGEPVELADDAHPWYNAFIEDVDRAGTDLTVFASHLLLDLLAYGRCHILAEYPNTWQLREQLGRPLTAADEREGGVRPYWVRVDPRHIIGWRGGLVGEYERLTQLRIRSQESEYEGDWGESTRDYITVWYEDRIERWTQDDRQEWVLAAEPTPNTLGRIPLTTVYARREGLLTAYPPLERLGWLNIKHWQQSSDQDQIEKVARVPLIFLAGFHQEEAQAIQIGAFRIIGARDPSARGNIMETSGNAVKVGRDGLQQLVDLMRSLSMAPLERRPGNPTATEMAIEAGRQVSDLEAYVMKLEKGLSRALRWAALWDRQDLDPPEVKISQDFGTTAALEVELTELREDRRMGDIPQRRYLWERQRRGLYSEDMDIDAEIEEAREEAGADLFTSPASVADEEVA